MILSAEWLAQAERDLQAGRHLLGGDFHEWAVLAAQQASEKAIKALRIALGTTDRDLTNDRDVKTHDLAKLLGTIADRSGGSALGRAAGFARHYEEARYPSARGISGGSPQAPFRTYTKQNAEDLLAAADAICRHCRELVDRAERFWTPNPAK